jgi:hypothetical protein
MTEIPLQFDPHIVHQKPWEPTPERKFKRFLSRAIETYGCVIHGQDCPLKQGPLILKGRTE